MIDRGLFRTSKYDSAIRNSREQNEYRGTPVLQAYRGFRSTNRRFSIILLQLGYVEVSPKVIEPGFSSRAHIVAGAFFLIVHLDTVALRAAHAS